MPSACRELQDKYDLRVVCGPGSYPGVLREAVPMMLICLLPSPAVTKCKHGGPVKLPIRCLTCPTKSFVIRSHAYLSAREKLFKGEVFHIDHLISPEQLVIEYMRRLIDISGGSAAGG